MVLKANVIALLLATMFFTYIVPIFVSLTFFRLCLSLYTTFYSLQSAAMTLIFAKFSARFFWERIFFICEWGDGFLGRMRRMAPVAQTQPPS